MKVALVVERFPKHSQTFIVRKVLGLLDAGLDVHVVCYESETDEWAWYPDLAARPDFRARVHVTRVGRSPGPVARAAGRFLRGASAHPAGTLDYLAESRRRQGSAVLRQALIDSWLLGLQPDVVHFEFGSEALVRLPLTRALGCPVTVSFRGFDLNFTALDSPHHYEDLWATVDAVHVLGEDLWRRARRRGCPEDLPHALIPPAVDADWFTPVARKEERVGTADRPLRIVSVGRLHWKKGYPDGLAAVRALLDRGLAVEHRVVGGGPAEDEVRACIRDLDLDRDVVLLGPRSREEVRDQLQWADVLLHSATSEGFGNAVLEAQAMALPIVCTDADGLPENVVDGVTGFVVARRCPAALADRLVVLTADPALRRRLGTAGRRRVIDHFGVDQHIERWVAFYREVAT